MNVPLRDILFFDELYQQIINVHGSMLWLGDRRDGVLSLWHDLREIYESAKTRTIAWADEGDNSLVDYLEENPATIIALAYLNTELFEVTRDLLKLIQPCLTVGSIVAFDKLNRPDCPGSTMALKEVWGLNAFAIQRSFYSRGNGYIIIT